MAERLKSAISQETEIVSLLNRVTLEIKKIDPRITKEELTENMCKEMNIQDEKCISVKSLSMGNTTDHSDNISQYRPAEKHNHKNQHWADNCDCQSSSKYVKMLQVPYARAKCNKMYGNKPWQRVVPKCGVKDHFMETCTNEPRCSICAKENRTNVRHITGLLTCPLMRDKIKLLPPSLFTFANVLTKLFFLNFKFLKGLARKHKGNKILNVLSASDHTYVLHDFKNY